MVSLLTVVCYRMVSKKFTKQVQSKVKSGGPGPSGPNAALSAAEDPRCLVTGWHAGMPGAGAERSGMQGSHPGYQTLR